MRDISRLNAVLRRAFVALAVVALAVLVLVPPGYMVGGGTASGPVRIVICTGHGPVTAAVDLGKSAPRNGGKAGAPCAFATHGACAAPIPAPPNVAAAWSATPASVVAQASQVSFGRGLAAPPPARGPPVRL